MKHNRSQFEDSHSLYRYSEQQTALNEIVAKLGVVCFRPCYHRAKGDKNTVLFYTKEDHAHNRGVDRQFQQFSSAQAADLPYHIDDRYVYRDHFWWFENSNVNGQLDYGFANFGGIDLCGLGWEERLEEAITKALEAKRWAENKPVQKLYTVKVTSITTVEVEAENEDQATERAGEEYWKLDSDETNMEIVSVDDIEEDDDA